MSVFYDELGLFRWETVPLGACLAIVVAFAVAIPISVHNQNARQARIDAICARRHVVGSTYMATVGKTVMRERLCVDPATGAIFDPAFMEGDR
jgi:hypothetical protein